MMRHEDGVRLAEMHGVELDEVLTFADFGEKAEGIQLTNRQMFARLLLMQDEERDRFFDMMRDASAAGYRCQLHDHDGMVDHYGMAMAAASVQQEEAETYYKRMRRALEIAHHWRNFARNLQDYLDGTYKLEQP